MPVFTFTWIRPFLPLPSLGSPLRPNAWLVPPWIRSPSVQLRLAAPLLPRFAPSWSLTFDLEDVVLIDDSIEDVEDGVDESMEEMRRQVSAQLVETDQVTEHDRHLVERLQSKQRNVTQLNAM